MAMCPWQLHSAASAWARCACQAAAVTGQHLSAIAMLQGNSTFGANSVIGARAATVKDYCLAPNDQLGVCELGFKPVMPTGLNMV